MEKDEDNPSATPKILYPRLLYYCLDVMMKEAVCNEDKQLWVCIACTDPFLMDKVRQYTRWPLARDVPKSCIASGVGPRG